MCFLEQKGLEELVTGSLEARILVLALPKASDWAAQWVYSILAEEDGAEVEVGLGDLCASTALCAFLVAITLCGTDELLSPRETGDCLLLLSSQHRAWH